MNQGRGSVLAASRRCSCESEGSTKASFFADLNKKPTLIDGDMTVRVEYSTIDAEDGLAVTGTHVIHAPVVAVVDLRDR